MKPPTTTLLDHLRRLTGPPAADAVLLSRWIGERDEEAFAALVARHGPMVLGVCQRILGDAHEAEDAFQAVFLILARKAASLRRPEALAGWLHGVAARLAYKARTAARRRAGHSRTLAVEPVDSRPDPLDLVTVREMLGLLDREIGALREVYRLPIVLCDLEGRTQEKAAEMLGWTLGSLRGRLLRGRAQLKARLTRRGLALPAGVVLSLLPATLPASSQAAGPLVAPQLVTTVSRAAVRFSIHPAAAELPVRAAELAREGLRVMTLGKATIAAAAVLTMTVLVAGAGLLTRQAWQAKPAEERREDKTPPAASVSKNPAEEKPQVRLDRFGDPLPDGAVARLGTVRWRHGFMVQALAYSPDGKKIVSTGGDRALVLWDAGTGKQLRVFPGRGFARGVAFSPDGKWIATTHRRGELWDAATGKILCELKNPQRGVMNALAVAPDGKTLATANADGAVHLWDPTTGEERRRLNGGQGGVNTLAYSPDGAKLAAGGDDGVVRLWDAATGKEIRRLANAKKDIRCVVFSPDGKQLAVWSHEDSLRLWDVATGRQIRTLGEKQRLFAPLPLVFSPDGKLLASANFDGTLSMWDAASGERKEHWRVGTLGGFSLAFSPDGKTIATAGQIEGVIRLWDAATGRERHPSEGHRGSVRLLRFAADKGTLISVGFDRRVLWWDMATQTPHRQFAWTTGNALMSFALSPDGNTLATGDWETHEVWLWDIRTGKATKLPGKHEGPIASIAFSPDGWLVASVSGFDQTIHVWDVREGKEVRQIKGFTNFVGSLCFSPDSKALACGSSPRRNSAKDEPTLRLWDVSSGKERCTFDSRIAADSALAFSPDGKVLASGNEYAAGEAPVRLWDATTGKALCRYTGHQSMIGAVVFSPDGKLVVSGTGKEGYFGDSSVHVWEAATGRLIRRFDGHHSWVWAVTFAADGLTVASGAGDSTILLWDITGRQKDGKLPPVALTPHQLDACWAALANEDVAKAYDAVWSFVAAGEQAVPFLQKHLPPIPHPEAKAVARLIADLDSNDFSVRDKATEALSKLGDAITPALQQALTGKPALEMRRRLQQLLDQSRDWTAERLRAHRAMQVLEHIGTRQAKEVLQALAAGEPNARLTKEAKAALRRMSR